MQWLSVKRKDEIFRLAAKYGCRANSSEDTLASLVSTVLGRQVQWLGSDELDPITGVVGGIEDDRGPIVITTAWSATNPTLVAFVFAHEVAHILLDHYVEGSFIFGGYTRREAEGDAFAYAYIYITSQHRIPGNGSVPYDAARRAIVAKNSGDRDFSWSSEKKLVDIAHIRRVQTEEENSLQGPDKT